MALAINNSEVNKLSHELVRYTGEPITQAIIAALQERLMREKLKKQTVVPLADEIMRIGQEYALLPELDNRTSNEILGYDKIGLPT